MEYVVLSDHELVALLKQSDRAAFTQIYNRYWKRMLAVASHKLHSIEDAEEVVQDIFLMLWNRRLELEIKSELAGYLAVSVKYRVIKLLDKCYNQHQYINTVIHRSSADNSTQEWLEFQELSEQLQHALVKLPEKCQLVYRLSRESNLSQKEIAAELNISEKTVEAHIGKAIKVLRAKLNYFICTLL